MREKQGTWDLTLCLAEFAYNNAVNRSRGKSPFDIVHDYSPCTLADLLSLPPDAQVSHPASPFAQNIHDLRAEIQRKIALNNDSYKHSTNMRRRAVSFEVSDFVMA